MTTASPDALASTGLIPKTWVAIQGVLATHPHVAQAILYGSRAMGRHKIASDIDLTLVGAQLTASEVGDIAAELDDLLLPYEFDLSAQHLLNHPELLAHIERVGVVVYP